MRPTHDRRLGEAWQGVVRLASALWWPVRIAGRLWDAAGASHTLALAADRAAHGGHRPDAGALLRHNLHSVRVGENLRRPHRWAGSPTRS